jgi:hypothetical protein
MSDKDDEVSVTEFKNNVDMVINAIMSNGLKLDAFFGIFKTRHGESYLHKVYATSYLMVASAFAVQHLTVQDFLKLVVKACNIPEDVVLEYAAEIVLKRAEDMMPDICDKCDKKETCLKRCDKKQMN